LFGTGYSAETDG